MAGRMTTTNLAQSVKIRRDIKSIEDRIVRRLESTHRLCVALLAISIILPLLVMTIAK